MLYTARMNTKLIIGYVGLFVGACVLLWSLLLVLFRKPPVKPHLKKYILRMTFGFVVYAAGVCVAHYFYTKQSPHGYWPIFLFPIIPVIYIVATITRFVSEGLDEMQRKIVTEAAAFSGLATGFTCISYLFAQNAGAPAFHAEWAFYMMWIYYGIGTVISARRYK
jgi:hypothetical protein